MLGITDSAISCLMSARLSLVLPVRMLPCLFSYMVFVSSLLLWTGNGITYLVYAAGERPVLMVLLAAETLVSPGIRRWKMLSALQLYLIKEVGQAPMSGGVVRL